MKRSVRKAVGRPGILVAGVGGTLAGKPGEAWTIGCRQPLTDGRCPGGGKGEDPAYDYPRLVEVLVELKKLSPDVNDVTVTASDDVPYQAIARTLAVARTGDAEAKPGAEANDRPLFPSTYLASVEEANQRLRYPALVYTAGAIEPAPRRPAPGPR